MELSFWSKILLEVTLAVLAVLTIFCPYLGILGAAIVIILIFNEITTHNSERADFKRKIIHEALGIVDHIIASTSASRILCPVWSGKTEGFKTDVLDVEDYVLWKQFYGAVEERNEYYRTREGLEWSVFAKFNRAIYDNFFNVLNGVLWVKQAIPEEDVSNLLSRAKQSACI
jgi:hypothetical protein